MLLQLPIGLEERFSGVIDLVEMRSLRFEGESGEEVRAGPIPGDMLENVRKAREEMAKATEFRPAAVYNRRTGWAMGRT